MRTEQEINAEWAQVAGALGEINYRVAVEQSKVQAHVNRMNELNQEMAKLAEVRSLAASLKEAKEVKSKPLVHVCTSGDESDGEEE